MDALARAYATGEGMQFRYSRAVTGMGRVNVDGTFKIPNLPIGKYELSFPSQAAMVPVKRRGDQDKQPLIVELQSNKAVTDVGEVELYAVTTIRAPLTKAAPSDDPFADSASTPRSPVQMVPKPDYMDPWEAEQKIKAALLRRVDELDFQGLPLNAVIDEISSRVGVPIRFDERQLQKESVSLESPVSVLLPAMTLQSALRNILSTVSNNITYTIRDEVLLITSKDAAAESASPKSPRELDLDSGDAFLEQWLESHAKGNAVDKEALRKALQAHLEKEFDAKQQHASPSWHACENC